MDLDLDLDLGLGLRDTAKLPPGSIIFHLGAPEMKHNAPRWELPEAEAGYKTAKLRADEPEVLWHNQPPCGAMSGGNFYLDGGSAYPFFPGRKRASWAIAQLNASGQVVSSASGLVPVSVSRADQPRW